MKLYHHPMSGHSHRARLFLSLAGIEHELVEATSAFRSSPEFVQMNRFKELPILDDDGTIVPDSIAIMVYAARRYGKTEWLPEEPVAAATVQRWLSVSTGQLFYGPCAARLVTIFKRKFDAEEAIAKSHALLKVLDAELGEREWIALTTPTIADPAFYSYIVAAPEGNVDISPYKNVDAWLRRVEALPGFVPFQKTKIGLAA